MLEYKELAEEFLHNMQFLFRAKAQKKLTGSLQGEFYILKYISLKNDNVTPGDLSNEMMISSARIASTLNSLEKKGYIERQIDIKDRRRIIIKLTDVGEKETEKYSKKVFDVTIKMFHLLGLEDSREYTRIIGKLANLIDNEESI